MTSGKGYGGWQVPDIVANLRVDQAWGNAQVMGALHEVNAPYYGGSVPDLETNWPSLAIQWGWAVGAGLHINVPMLGPADYIEGEVNYSQGASKYDIEQHRRHRNHFSFSQGGSGGVRHQLRLRADVQRPPRCAERHQLCSNQ